MRVYKCNSGCCSLWAEQERGGDSDYNGSPLSKWKPDSTLLGLRGAETCISQVICQLFQWWGMLQSDICDIFNQHQRTPNNVNCSVRARHGCLWMTWTFIWIKGVMLSTSYSSATYYFIECATSAVLPLLYSSVRRDLWSVLGKGQPSACNAKLSEQQSYNK